jgi:hypothetical protein
MSCQLCGFESIAEYCSQRCEELQRRSHLHNPQSTSEVPAAITDDLPFEYIRDALAFGRQWYFATQHSGAADVRVYSATLLCPGDLIDLTCPTLRHLDAAASLHPSEWLLFLDSGTSNVTDLHEALHRRRRVAKDVVEEHSCAPSLFTYSGTHRCTDRLVIGSPLTRSALSSVELYMSTTVRRDILALQHGVPRCRCRRCMSEVDSSRQIRCHCGGAKLLQQPTHLADPLWRCGTCGGVWTEIEINALHKEEALSKMVYELWGALTRISAGLEQLSKRTFEALKDVVSQAETYLGVGHWVSLVAAKCGMSYYDAITKRSPETRAFTEQLVCGWLQYAVRCAHQQRLFVEIPWHVSSDLKLSSGLIESPAHALFRKRLDCLLDDARHRRSVDESLSRLIQGDASPQELLHQWEEFLIARVGENEAARNYMLQRL